MENTTQHNHQERENEVCPASQVLRNSTSKKVHAVIDWLMLGAALVLLAVGSISTSIEMNRYRAQLEEMSKALDEMKASCDNLQRIDIQCKKD